jgi:hypothetical protein
MTFIAQPYEQFVDDLLTALTGGLIREEHRFMGSDEPYSLSSPGALVSSIKVFGQRQEAFFQFAGGLDYGYEAAEQGIRWLLEGRHPDDHSYFYVNYYVQEGRRHLTDRNPGSVTTTLAEAFARELAVLHKQMEMIYQSAFVDTATSRSLDHVAALLGLTRKDARFAIGEVLCKRSTPASGDITIPAGTLVSTHEGQNFETTDKRTLRKGQLSIAAPIQAQVEGPAGRVEAEMIQNINRPIFGIESAINEKATYFATEKETDEAFRRRLKGSLERAGKSTLNAIKYGLVESIPGLNEGNVQVEEKANVPGLVEVKFGLTVQPEADWVSRMEEVIFQSRPAGIRVVHNLPTRSPTPALQAAAPVAATGARPRSQIASLDEKVLAQMPEGVVRLRADVSLNLVEVNLSAVQKEQIEDQVRHQILDYIEALPMGADIIYNKLLGRIVQVDQVADAMLSLDALTAGTPAYTGNLATHGRKAAITLTDISVGLMEETVHVRLYVKLEPKAGSSPAASKVPPSLQTAIENAVNQKLAEATGSLTKEALVAAIKAVVDQEQSWQMAASGAIILSAEYEESGGVLNNTEIVNLASNQLARLKSLEVKLKGSLDG